MCHHEEAREITASFKYEQRNVQRTERKKVFTLSIYGELEIREDERAQEYCTPQHNQRTGTTQKLLSGL